MIDEETEGWRRLHNIRLNNFYSSVNISVSRDLQNRKAAYMSSA
jgi:hypothetical protein